jgi:DNA polymerase-3 subunit epsilon
LRKKSKFGLLRGCCKIKIQPILQHAARDFLNELKWSRPLLLKGFTMKAIYYDTETTGVKPGKDRIIEIAAFEPQNNRSFCSFTNPECPIPAESTAITGITDEMVKDAPPIRLALEAFVSFCEGECVLIAHNNDAFDKLFLEAEFQRAGLLMPEWIFIDSLKWSRKYRNDLPRHSLQFLREVYGIEANQAHRALDDVMVLYRIFSQMIGDLDLKTVLSLLKQTPQAQRMPFGKHAGKLLTEIPKEYVLWLAREGALDKKENAQLKETFEKMGLMIGVL